MTIRLKRPKIGITLKLFFLFAFIGLIPISFMSFYTFWQINRQVAFKVEDTLTDMGLRLRDDVNRSIEDMVREVGSVAEDPIFSNKTATPDQIVHEFMRIREGFSDVIGIYLLQGRRILAESGSPAFFMADMDSLEFSVNSLHMVPPRPFPGTNDPVFLISAPITVEPGTDPTVLFVAVDFRRLTEATTLIRIGETGRAYIVDEAGLIMAGSEPAQLFKPFGGEAVSKRLVTVGEGIIHYTTDNNERYIAFVTKVPGVQGVGPRGLKVLVTYRENEAYTIAGQIRRSLGLAIILILVATSLISLMLSQTITRPVKEIIRGTERIGAGDFSREITVRSHDEIGDLARSFNRMAWELSASREFVEHYNQELERQVRERSRDLAESEEKYRMVVEGSGDGWTILDESLSIRFANLGMGRLFGTMPETLIGKGLSAFLLPHQKKKVVEAVKFAVKHAGSPVTTVFEARGGTGRLTLETTFSAMPMGEREGWVIAHLVDKTELTALAGQKERLQLELMERSKHSQIGIMTEGLFHNLNNPLQALMGVLKVVNQDIADLLTADGVSAPGPPDEARRRIVEDIGEAYAITRRLSDQVKNLLLKIRDESKRKVEDLDINRIIEAEVSFLEADLFFKHKVKKRLFLADDLPRLPGVYSDISQSFVNIILNAVDAMRESEGGTLTITTSLDEKKIRVDFHDTGKGIDERHIPRIFDPFFTTKHEAEQGTGLGLFTVDFLLKPYEIIYRVTSRPGDTLFVLLFPVGGITKRRRDMTTGERKPRRDPVGEG